MSALKPMRSILAEFGNHYKVAISNELVDETIREDRLRVSGFPFCGLKTAYRRLVKDETPQKMNFGSRYYTGVGTLTHEIIQDMIGLQGRVLGQWKCMRYKCNGFRAISRKSSCPICGSQMKYEELTVKAFKWLSGHLDGIYKTDDGEYFVIDYKTSSTKVITTQHERRTLPYHHNVCQIKAYCALIELMFDIKISGWMLHYIARDNPLITYRTEGARISEKEKRQQLKLIKKYDRHYGIGRTMTTFKEFMQLVEEKPCKTREDYQREFDSFTPCPLSQGGLCFQPKPLKEFLKIVWDDSRAKL